ncbi:MULTISPECIES: hypothetical protein [unclassified Streptomyces]|uniref:hypothetical protein n=1 Tax=unclassified Streptomyces TaxID=2593676 RepID=UPI0006AED425|nr:MULTISPECIES: hypothetical protein [unclassified Streptomyces]
MLISSLLDEHTRLMCNADFCARVRAAFVRIAREVLAERPDTDGYPLRSALARGALTPSDLLGPGYAPLIATDPAISAAAAAGHVEGQPGSAQAAVTDGQLLDAVRRAWNLIAGVVEWREGAVTVD